jgi:hypothetical protein
VSKPKDDAAANRAWGSVYDSIPKQVFALVALHLADGASAEGYGNGGERTRFAEEVRALRDNGILPAGQADRVLRALARKP